MAVYSNDILERNNIIYEMNECIAEGNNLYKILESYNILTENCIVIQEDGQKNIIRRFIDWLVSLKNKFVDWLKRIKEKISTFFKKKYAKDVEIKELDIPDVVKYNGLLKDIASKSNAETISKCFTSRSNFNWRDSNEKLLTAIKEMEELKPKLESREIRATIRNVKVVNFIDTTKKIEDELTKCIKVMGETIDEMKKLESIGGVYPEYKECFGSLIKYRTIELTCYTLLQKIYTEVISDAIAYVNKHAREKYSQPSQNNTENK